MSRTSKHKPSEEIKSSKKRTVNQIREVELENDIKEYRNIVYNSTDIDLEVKAIKSIQKYDRSNYKEE